MKIVFNTEPATCMTVVDTKAGVKMGRRRYVGWNVTDFYRYDNENENDVKTPEQ